MTLVTHVASHPDQLVSRLCEQLASPPDHLFAAEVIAVPTRGIERWLTQRIASDLAERGIGDGICANVDFPSPRRLVREVLLAVPDLATSVTGWEGAAFTGHLVDAIDANLAEPWMHLLARYLKPADDREAEVSPNRLSAARKVARLFSGYARRRPDMIRAWAAGDDVGSDGEQLPDGDQWQPQLWRIVRDQIGVPGLPELMPDALEPIRSGAIDLDLPDRIAVYGLTATDPFDLDVLVALAVRRDIHLHVLHPSPGLWAATQSHLTAEPSPVQRPTRDDDTTQQLAAHPLLKAWARDSRELQVVLAGHGLTGSPVDETDSALATTVLTRLQREIRHNREPEVDADLAATVEAGADRSVQIHVCHGARRQAEVLRDAILHLLVADPSLEPRDIAIMTPDLATFAPLLEAAFPSEEAATPDGLPDLRLRIADRSPAATNPLVRFTANLLAVVDGRLEAGVIRELVARPVVQQRFGFDADAAGAIVDVINESNIAWGIDGDDRQMWGAGPNDERTWSRGIDRALAGVFYSDSAVRLVDTIAPLDGVEGQEGTPVGLLAQIIDRIKAIRRALDVPMPMSQWARAISSSVQLLAAPAWGDDWQRDQLERLLAETFPAPEPASHTTDDPGADSPDAQTVDSVVGLPEARLAIAGWAEDRPSPLQFRTGNVTVCTLAPMRSVPYRVVCLLGMDEERFPRAGRSDGDDLLLGHELVGDHDRSAEDRQLLLDAVMAAEQHLIVTYSGRDELTNADLPPAVPIAELEDTLREMVGLDGRRRLMTTHKLQAFSEDNFTAAAPGVPGPWAFDSMQLDGAVAVQQRTDSSTAASVSWPPCDDDDPVRLTDLITFLQHPAKRFLRARLGLTIPEADETPDDTLPADIAGLERWGVEDRLLSGTMEGHDLDALAARERAGDALPPGDLGTDDIEAARESVTILWSAATDQGYDPRAHVPFRGLVDAGGRGVEGSVLADPGRAHLVTVTPSRLKAKRRLSMFAELVFVSLLAPDHPWTAILIGKRPAYGGHLAITMGPIGDDPADRQARSTDLLAGLVSLYDEGHRAPIPMPCDTAWTWQCAVDAGKGREFGATEKSWETDRFAEANDPIHRMLFPDLGSTDALLDAGLAAYGERLWGPILPLCVEKRL